MSFHQRMRILECDVSKFTVDEVMGMHLRLSDELKDWVWVLGAVMERVM